MKKTKKAGFYRDACLQCVFNHDKEGYMKNHPLYINALRRKSNMQSLIDFRRLVKLIYKKQNRPCPFI